MKKIIFGLVILALMSTLAFAGTSDTQEVDVTMGSFMSITAPATANITLAEDGAVWDGSAAGDLTYTANVAADISCEKTADFSPTPGATIALSVGGTALSGLTEIYDNQAAAVDATKDATVAASVATASILALDPGTYTATLTYTIAAH
jgi:hypothetical protein